MLRILVLTKRQYMNKDLIDDQFGRFREIPLALARLGHKVTGLCLSYKQKNEGWLTDETVRWKSFNAGLFKIFGLMRFIAEARRQAKKSDIIWACSDSFYGIIGHIISVNTGIPLVFDLYDNFEFFLAAKLPVINQLYHHTIKKCTSITCVSQPLAKLVNSYGRKENVVVLENAARKDIFYPMPQNSCRAALGLPKNCQLIGTAGALTNNRGIKNLFAAFDLLKDRHVDLHLAIAGPRKTNLPCDDRIHDLGVLAFEKVPLLLNALDVAVICNLDNEFGKYCFPQKAVEIMACDVPLIAARVGSMKELFANHPEWLYEPGNPLSLAETLERRLVEKKTDYDIFPTWKDLALEVEKIMLNL